MTFPPKQTAVLAAIEAASDWIKARDLAEVTGISDHKAVQQHIRKLKANGAAIVNGPFGYRIGSPHVVPVVRKRKPRAKDHTCPCGKAISANKSGMCQPCSSRAVLADPAVTVRRLAALRDAKSTEEHRERARLATLRREAERRDDPEWQAYKLESGKRLQRFLSQHPEVEPERIEALRRAAAVKMAWCPADRLDEYRRLTCSVGSVEARRMIEEDLAAKARAAEAAERRRIAALSPFQRQEERLARGGRVVAKPVFRRRDPDYTLGGIATGAL